MAICLASAGRSTVPHCKTLNLFLRQPLLNPPLNTRLNPPSSSHTSRHYPQELETALKESADERARLVERLELAHTEIKMITAKARTHH